MTKSKVFLLTGLCLLAASMLLCFSPPVQGAERKEIIVGAPLPLTGGMAGSGRDCQWTYEESARVINEKGGIFVKQYNKKLPIRIVVADGESDPGKTAAAFERLVKVDKVDVVLSSITGNLVMPSAVAADKLKVFYHTTSCFLSQWRQAKFKWSTVFFFELSQVSDNFYEILNSIPVAERPKKLALIMEDSLDGRTQEKGLRESAKKYKYDIVMTESLGVGAKDYSASILKLKAAGIDGAFLICSTGDAITFTRQLKEAQYNIPFILGNKGTTNAEYWNSLGKDANYVMLDGIWNEDWPLPGAKELGEKYTKKFNKRGATIGMYYATSQTLWQGIEKAGTLDGAKVRQAVLSTPFKGTVMGDVKYNPDGSAVFITGVLQWMNGERKTVYPFNLSAGWKVALAPPWSERK
jgi:branched-chain amino acid transport system substrate-binding protein